MKRSFKNSTILLFAILCAAVISCNDDDDDFTHVSALEQAIQNEINSYRSSKDLPELVLQFSMVKEAQDNSVNWSNGLLGDDITSGMTDHIQTIKDKLGGTTSAYILSSWNGQVDAASIVDSWANNPSLDSVLVGEFTQSGPGTATDADGKLYVTQIFLNIPAK